MYRLIIWLVLAAVLVAGCGGNASTSAPTSAEAVHAAWVAGLQHNDRQALLQLADAGGLTSIFVDTELNRMREIVQTAKDGPLQSVEVRALVDAGAGKEGLSLWHFAQKTVCYQATLAEQGGAWKVTRWGIVVEHCKGEA